MIELKYKYQREVSRLWEILEEACVVERTPDGFSRDSANPFITDKPAGERSAKELSAELIATYPQSRSEHGLLHLLGPHLAKCLMGRADSGHLLFGSDTGRALLEDVYSNRPDLRAATLVLRNFVATPMLLYRGIASASLARGRNLFLVPDGLGSGSVFGPLAPLLQESDPGSL
ncbi:hypothetical protein LX32DRAFT_691610 [Colletotrichum zoysiae]|uniref:Uncharacterized protein n=1 Tax=Colletotrichum zoysiae TaxID=1216348 RepID=A0AAD9HP19_9PEZI|nr:hypothetical protein LX32DRAFT_691610 [Colletotrichum zoysiae]